MRKLIDCIESDKPNFAKQYFVDKAILEAEFVLEMIDKRWPAAVREDCASSFFPVRFSCVGDVLN